MDTTTNLGLKKPAETDFYNVNDFNENADKIDEAIAKKAEVNAKKNPSDTTGDIIDTHLTVGSRGEGEIGGLSFVSGMFNTASGDHSGVFGGFNNATSGDQSGILGGESNIVNGDYSVVIGGSLNSADGEYSACFGVRNKSLDSQVKMGHFSKDGAVGAASGTIGDAFAIGNGTNSAQSNCFRVGYDGNVYGLSGFKSTGADYAEMFEWQDGNPDGADRRGIFVTLDGEKIRIANADDNYILGVVSAAPSVCGDTQSEVWQGMYLRDSFGAYKLDEAGNMMINPDYDNEQEYIPREQRKEWAAVGMLGKLIVCDHGDCQPNGYCYVGADGKAVASEVGYRVLSRIDETHIKILFK